MTLAMGKINQEVKMVRERGKNKGVRTSRKTEGYKYRREKRREKYR
jgi:hypothetical protein